MRSKKIVYLSILAAFLGLIVFSCNQNKDIAGNDIQLTNADVSQAGNDATSDNIYDDVDGTVESQLTNLQSTDFQTNTQKSAEDVDYPCLVVTVDHPDTTFFPKVITLDYGEGCTKIFKNDTITKKGKIIIKLTDRMWVPGAKRIITFDNFYINNIKVEGTRTITFNGLNADSLLDYDITLVGGKLIFNDTLQYTRESQLKREWYRAPNPMDDIVYLSGSITGTNLQGENYSRMITDKLMLIHCFDYGRRWTIVAGTVVCTVGTTETTIDYGNGSCESTAYVERNGQKREFQNRIRFRNQNH